MNLAIMIIVELAGSIFYGLRHMKTYEFVRKFNKYFAVLTIGILSPLNFPFKIIQKKIFSLKFLALIISTYQ